MRRASLLAAIPPGAGRVAVEGSAAEVGSVEELLGELLDGTDPPRAVVVVSGGVEAIERALSSVADGGVVVVTAPTPDRAPLDLYGDLHVRGLRLVVLE